MRLNGYEAAAEMLGKRESRKVANNTYLQRRGEQVIALKLHKTDILLYTPGRVTYNTGGWQTYVTKDRMNKFGPAYIWSDRGQWYIGMGGLWADREKTSRVYTEGCWVEGGVIGGCDEDQAFENKKLRQRVKKYAAAFMDALENGKVGPPSNGDCWYCSMRTEGETGKVHHGLSRQAEGRPTLGEGVATLHPDGSMTQERNTDHLLSHLVEGYYVPSLLVRALEVQGASQTMWWWVGSWWDQAVPADTIQAIRSRSERVRVEKALRRYVGRQLGLAV